MISSYLLIIILSVVEGITEFLPISSTGHMILVEKFLGNGGLSTNFLDTFLIVVQLGAILAVVICFWGELTPFVKSKDLLYKRIRLWVKIIVGVLPAVIFGLLLDDYISKYFMGNVVVVASTLIFYGIILILIELYYKNKTPKIKTIGGMSYRIAFIIGFFQCLAMIPGTSRSGATIIGALLLGVGRSAAAEFSFFLAIPTMFGATCLKLLKNGLNFTVYEWKLMALGTFIAFIVAFIVIKWFMAFIKKRDFIPFGIYRIILGIIVLIMLFK